MDIIKIAEGLTAASTALLVARDGLIAAAPRATQSPLQLGTGSAPGVIPPNPVPPVSPPAPPASPLNHNVLVITLSGTTCQGVGAEAVVKVGDVEVGRVIVTDQKDYSFGGVWGSKPSIEVVFDNDAIDATGDRNLTVLGGTYDGAVVNGLSAWLFRNGSVRVADPTAPAPPPPPPYVPPEVSLVRPAWVQMDKRRPWPLQPLAANETLYEVGPGKPYANVRDAWNAYTGDASATFAVIQADPRMPLLYGQDKAGTVRGYIGKSVRFQSADPTETVRVTAGAWGPENGKSLYTAAAPGITVEFHNWEISGCNDPYSGHRNNMCAITVEDVADVTVRVRGCVFYECGNAMGRGDGLTTVWDIDGGTLIQRCGGGGDGYSHNIYVLGKSVRFANSTSIEAFNGHAFKSRCLESTLIGSHFGDGEAGTASYLNDFPDAGAIAISTCTYDKGPNSQNQPIIHIGQEKVSGFHPNSSAAISDVSMVSRRADAVGIRTRAAENIDVPGMAVLPMVVPVVTALTVTGLTMDRVYDDGLSGRLPDGADTLLVPVS